jgi:hypothetical protein
MAKRFDPKDEEFRKIIEEELLNARLEGASCMAVGRKYGLDRNTVHRLVHTVHMEKEFYRRRASMKGSAQPSEDAVYDDEEMREAMEAAYIDAVVGKKNLTALAKSLGIPKTTFFGLGKKPHIVAAIRRRRMSSFAQGSGSTVKSVKKTAISPDDDSEVPESRHPALDALISDKPVQQSTDSDDGSDLEFKSVRDILASLDSTVLELSSGLMAVRRMMGS